MKKITIIYIGLFLLIGFACEDMEFIQPDPKDRITQEIALRDLDGAEAVLYSAYNRLINFNNYGQQMMLIPDALADNIIVGNNTGRYTGEVVNEARAHMDIWNDPNNPNSQITNANPTGYTVRGAYNAYSTINDCNITIYAATENRNEEPARADQIIGQAQFIRALSYHDLLRVYSYEPGKEVNGWDKGVILRTEPVFGAADADLRTRSTNLEGYQLVESDLLSAIALLPDESSAPDAPYVATKAAARALLSRVYLYWGKYSEAATMAEAALTSTSATLVDAADYVASWEATTHPESIFELQVAAQDWNTVDGVNNSLATITNTIQPSLPSAQGAVKASDELIAAYEAGDVRRDLWVNPSAPDFWESEKWQGELGDYRENIPLIRVSEVVLIAAEAKARSGNDAGALSDINMLRSKRGLGNSTATGQSLLNLILNERRVELCLEGHRFFDFKRLGLPVPKPTTAGFAELSPSDFRILAPLNSDAVSVNTELEQNPNY